MSKPKSILEIAKEMKALAEKATPGPWEAHGALVAEVYCDCCADSAPDAQFIAATRTNAPLLADAVIEMVEFMHVVGCTDQPDRIYAGDSHAFYLKRARELLTKLGRNDGGRGMTIDRSKYPKTNADFDSSIDFHKASHELIKQELEAILKLSRQALNRIVEQDRTRGYPTGVEWGLLVRIARTALDKLGNQ